MTTASSNWIDASDSDNATPVAPSEGSNDMTRGGVPSGTVVNAQPPAPIEKPAKLFPARSRTAPVGIVRVYRVSSMAIALDGKMAVTTVRSPEMSRNWNVLVLPDAPVAPSGYT
jgi:hypothetical protein